MSESKVGLVIIGRNEEANLRLTLPTLPQVFNGIVYVDSNSSDASVSIANENDVEVVELDMSIPFSAGRARNAGFNHLVDSHPEIEFVQFLDGDCEILPSFIDSAVEHLRVNTGTGIVVGRNRERYPENSIYNAICDIEWNTPVGELLACGGIFMIRAEPMRMLGGFDEQVIAGEEPELCVRLRAAGYTIIRIDEEMSLHDAEMKHFKQWWTRSVRAGHSYGQLNFIHGAPPVSMHRNKIIKLSIHTVTAIFGVLGGILLTPTCFLLLLLFPLRAIRIYSKYSSSEHGNKVKAAYSLLTSIACIPEFLGLLKFHWRRITGKKMTIIEY